MRRAAPVILYPAAPLTVSGQAVIEGVMMQSPRFTSVAVRRDAHGLLVDTRRALSPMIAQEWLGLPVLRGFVTLIETLIQGILAIVISARAATSQGHRSFTPREIGLSLGTGVALSLAIFLVLPALVLRAVQGYLGSDLLTGAGGLLRIALIIGYIGVIGWVPNIRRVYQYHGAEHKVVNAFESGLPLEVTTVRECSRFHPHCGTSFALVVMFVAVAAFAFLNRPPFSNMILERLLLLPVVAGASYELLLLAGRSRDFSPLALPGIWLQHLTTREPDDGQLEVAIRALREVLEAEGRVKDHSSETGEAMIGQTARSEAIIVGTIYKGGLVLASASWAGSDHPEFHEFNFDGARGILAGAGESLPIVRAKEIVEEKSEVENIHSSRGLAELVEAAVGESDVTAILGTYCQGEACLYTVHSEGVTERKEGYASLGTGSELAEYLLAKRYRSTFTRDRAIRMAVLVVEEVRKAHSQSSGPTRVAVVKRGGIERKTEAEIIKVMTARRKTKTRGD